MTSPAKILIQLDSDTHPSVFDAVVAIDAGVDHLLQYGSVEPSAVEGLVHGALFTRGGEALRHTAIFVGGSETTAGEALLRAVSASFFGKLRVSVLLDSNGCNTTAAAAVLTALRHVDPRKSCALVVGGTGPVGRRVARLLLSVGCRVKLGSRSAARAAEVARSLQNEDKEGQVPGNRVEPVAAATPAQVRQHGAGCQILVAAGAAGVTLVPADVLDSLHELRVAIDLNAVPPLGIGGIAATDKAAQRGERMDYGALGVGGLKMKIHRAAIQRLYTGEPQVLDAEQVLDLGRELI